MTRTIRVPLGELAAGERRIDGDEAHYLVRVLRVRPGTTFTAFDPARRLEAAVTVLEVQRDDVRARVSEPTPAAAFGEPDVTLVYCAGKGDKVDEVVRAATALAVSRVLVATSERSVARGPTSPERRKRWAAIALDAARQSGRGDVPELAGPLPFADALARAASPGALKLCLEPAAEIELGALLRERGERALVLLVGPEGGFSAEELAAARDAGFEHVRLGTLVLRTELAAAAALAAALAHERRR
jgi:16S rRNA (uracil1498-N3)-methyltransferase